MKSPSVTATALVLLASVASAQPGISDPAPPVAPADVASLSQDFGTRGAFTAYVDADAAFGGDGQSWATAFSDLQLALGAARQPGSPIREIRVADGVYYPNVPGGARTSSFTLVSNVTIVGGFAGQSNAVDPDFRDLTAQRTILSGDINRDDPVSIADNVYSVVSAVWPTSGVAMDGVEITAGSADGDSAYRGAGIFLDNASGSFRACRIFGNRASAHGAGVFTFAHYTWFDDCEFADNTAPLGAGVCVSFSPATFRRCTFIGNTASIQGGGFAVIMNGSNGPHLIDCTFRENHAPLGGAISCSGEPTRIRGCRFEANTAERGGAIALSSGEPVIVSSVFVHNEAIGGSLPRGGAIFVTDNGDPYLVNCSFLGNTATGGLGGAVSTTGAIFATEPRLYGCVFSGNSADRGGAACFEQVASGTSNFYFKNCTFSRNTAATAGGAVYFNLSGGADVLCELANTILWENQANAIPQIGVSSGTTSNIRIIYSCIQGGWSGPGGDGNIAVDPRFIDADGPNDIPGDDDDNLRLRRWVTGPESLCIDAGSNEYLPPDAADFDSDGQRFEAAVFEIDSVRRRADEFNSPDVGAGTWPIVDMGAYESQDCDGDLVQDGQALAAGNAADCDADGIIDACELAGHDCNDNGTPDSCDIRDGVSIDTNFNGIPDECEPPCPGDLDNDRSVDLQDLATLLSNFGRSGDVLPRDGDIDADLDVDLQDLATLLGAFGGGCP